MFQFAPGCRVPFPEKIHEGFEVFENSSLYANISFEKLPFVVEEFYHSLPEPLFLALQLPLSSQEEEELGCGEGCHQEVLYLDGQSVAQIEEILTKYGDLLYRDGMSQFAVASHSSHEEIFVQKYKLVDLYSPTPRKWIPLLQKYGIEETKHLVTVWDTFCEDAPGECRRLTVSGMDVYQMADELKTRGLYRAKIIED